MISVPTECRVSGFWDPVRLPFSCAAIATLLRFALSGILWEKLIKKKSSPTDLVLKIILLVFFREIFSTHTHKSFKSELGKQSDSGAARVDFMILSLLISQESNGPSDAYAAISNADRLQAEPESLRKWREEQKERLEMLGDCLFL